MAQKSKKRVKKDEPKILITGLDIVDRLRQLAKSQEEWYNHINEEW